MAVEAAPANYSFRHLPVWVKYVAVHRVTVTITNSDGDGDCDVDSVEA